MFPELALTTCFQPSVGQQTTLRAVYPAESFDLLSQQEIPTIANILYMFIIHCDRNSIESNQAVQHPLKQQTQDQLDPSIFQLR